MPLRVTLCTVIRIALPSWPFGTKCKPFSRTLRWSRISLTISRRSCTRTRSAMWSHRGTLPCKSGEDWRAKTAICSPVAAYEFCVISGLFTPCVKRLAGRCRPASRSNSRSRRPCFCLCRRAIRSANGSLPLILAATVYPFFPQYQLLLFLTVLGGATAACIVAFLVQLNRDELVSRITRGTPNRFTPDLAVVHGAAAYVLPILAAL